MAKRFFLLLSIFTLIVVVSSAWFFTSLMPVSNSKAIKRFDILPGETASQIGIDLAKDGFIKNALAFRIYSQITQSAKNIKPGSYDLTTNLWIPQIIKKLLEGPTLVWVTVPEGLRREEVVQKFVDSFGLAGEKATAFTNQFLQLTTGKEGYLFPDTYLFAKDATPAQVVKILENTFNQKYASIKVNTNLNKEQIVILASIIQREAISIEDMQGVASVLTNRLNIGMALGSDVTLEYALGYQPDAKTWWKEDLTVDDLALQSPYNTRLNLGLPPTPISNPGLVALEAAANPPETNYLYYLSDKDGKLHFATTLEEHNANIDKYLQ